MTFELKRGKRENSYRREDLRGPAFRATEASLISAFNPNAAAWRLD